LKDLTKQEEKFEQFE